MQEDTLHLGFAVLGLGGRRAKAIRVVGSDRADPGSQAAVTEGPEEQTQTRLCLQGAFPQTHCGLKSP